MKGVVGLAMLASAACVSAQSTSERTSAGALSVFDVIERQRELIGTRILIRGRLSHCQRLSCSLLGVDRNGRERFLSIGWDAAFDSVAERHSGQTVEIKARLTDVCLPDGDPTIIAVCADRPGTLADPVFMRAL
jgi:hypothetical protein